MISFLAGCLFGLWLGAFLVWSFFEHGVKAGYDLYITEKGNLSWQKN